MKERKRKETRNIESKKRKKKEEKKTDKLVLLLILQRRFAVGSGAVWSENRPDRLLLTLSNEQKYILYFTLKK